MSILSSQNGQANIVTSLDNIATALHTWGGPLNDLNTSDKRSLVSAINEVKANANTNASNITALHDIYAILDEHSTADNGAGIHNSLYRGKNLGAEPTAEQLARIADGTFKGLWTGDYWSKSITHNYLYAPRNSSSYSIEGDDEPRSQTITPVMRIADHNYYRRAGDNIDLTTHHLVVVPDASLYSDPMKQGVNSTAGGYALSDMRTKYLAGAENAFTAFFGASHLLSYRDVLVNAVTEIGRASCRERVLEYV